MTGERWLQKRGGKGDASVLQRGCHVRQRLTNLPRARTRIDERVLRKN